MDFNLSEEQRILVDAAERFVREALDLKPAERRPAQGDLWRQVAEMGWLCLPFAEEAGGLGGTFEDVLVLMTALGRGVVSLPYVSNIVLCGGILGRARGEAAGATLRALAAGEVRVALAETDSAAGGVTAVREANGFILRGAKTLCYDAPGAGKLIVQAQHGEEGPGLFLVDAAAPEARMEAYPLIDGGSAADVRFDSVAAEARLAFGPQAAALLVEMKDRAVLANLAQIVGAIEACLQICADYLKVREQFGQPLGRFQALQHMMAQMFIEAQEARSILYYALSRINEPQPERRAAIDAARIVIGDAGRLVTEHGIQLHGAYGVTDEFAISHYYRKVFCLARMFAADHAIEGRARKIGGAPAERSVAAG